MRVTVPALPEPLRVSINSVMMTGNSPEATLRAVRRAAAKRGVDAQYELASREEYVAFRTALREKVAS